MLARTADNELLGRSGKRECLFQGKAGGVLECPVHSRPHVSFLAYSGMQKLARCFATPRMLEHLPSMQQVTCLYSYKQCSRNKAFVGDPADLLRQIVQVRLCKSLSTAKDAMSRELRFLGQPKRAGRLIRDGLGVSVRLSSSR